MTAAIGFLDNEMVRRIQKIFGNPKSPAIISQSQFDGAQEELEMLARMPWAEVSMACSQAYLDDLAYMPLQQDLFDYLFPALLIDWWQGLVRHPSSIEALYVNGRLVGQEVGRHDIYWAIDSGELLDRMMDAKRRAELLSWMVDAYVQGVNAWTEDLPEDLTRRSSHARMLFETFHGLGQSVPIVEAILEELQKVDTEGKVKWWLVILIQLCFSCWSRPLSEDTGGRRIPSEAHIAHGYLSSNLAAAEVCVTLDQFKSLLSRVDDGVFCHGTNRWLASARNELVSRPQQVQTQMTEFLACLSNPYLKCGGKLRS